MFNQIFGKSFFPTSEQIRPAKRKQAFEEYLEEQFWRDEPMTLDDDMPEAFNDWLDRQDVNDIITYAQRWGDKLTK